MSESRSTAAAVGTLSPSTDQNGRSNPYVGPRALGPGEPIYGREHELLDLRDLLIAERIVLLYSPSGAGKTSLIQAGLIPEMEREEFAVLPLMRVGKNPAGMAGNRYLASAILSLEEKLAPGDASSPAADVAGISFADYLEMRKDLLPPGDSKLLIFDQFEEILTVDPLDQEGKAEFFAQVGAALRDTSRWALFSIREDYVAALDPYTRAVPTRLKSNLRLDLLTPEAARLAIEKPADNQGVSFTPEATSQLIDDLRRVTVQSRAGTFEARLGPYVEPVHLQVVCSQLWEKPRSDPSKIGVEELATIGDVDSALGEYYATHVGKIARETGVKEKAIREWFDRSLITESGIRSEVMWQPGGSEGLNNAAIDALEAAHLVRKEERRDATWLELSHNRLVNPIRTNNARWFEAHLSLLQQQSVLWERQNRNDALCLEGKALLEAEEWARQHPNELSETDKEFLKDSREKESLRSAKLLKARIAVLSGVIIALGFLAFIAIVQWLEADKQRNLAEQHARSAETQAKIARNQATIADARRLAVRAQRVLEERLDLAIVLAEEAARKAGPFDLPDVRGAALTAAFANPRLVSYLNGHQTPVEALAFSPDNQFLAAGDWKGRIAFWNVQTRRPEKVLGKSELLSTDVIRSIAFSPDTKFLAAGTARGSIIRHDLKSGETKRFATSPQPINIWAIAFSPERERQILASSDSAGSVTVWDVETLQALHTAKTNGGARTVTFNADGSLLAAGSDDGRVTILAKSGTSWVLFDEFDSSDNKVANSKVTRIAFSPKDPNLLACGSTDWTVTLRDVAGKKYIARGDHLERVSSLAFSNEGILVTGSWDNSLRLWTVPAPGDYAATTDGQSPSGNPMRALTPIGPPLTGHVGSVFGVAFSSDGAFLASGGRDRAVILWDPKCYLPDVSKPGTSRQDFVLALSRDGRYEATGYKDGKIYCREQPAGHPPPEPTFPAQHATAVRYLGFSQDSRFLISASNDDEKNGTVIVTDMALPGKPASTFQVKGKITLAALSPDGRKAAIAYYEDKISKISIWDVATGAQEGPPLPDPPNKTLKEVVFNALVFNRDGKRLAAGGNNEFACIWDLDTRKGVATAEQHTGQIWALEFSPVGELLATGSGDTTILLWDAKTGELKSPFLAGHRDTVLCLAFSPDGKILASGSKDKSVILWDVETRSQMSAPLLRNLDSVRAVALSSDGNKLYSSSYYENTVASDLSPAWVKDRCRARANHNLTKLEWEFYFRGEEYRKTWLELPTGDEDLQALIREPGPRF